MIKITTAETEIMEALWRAGPLTAEELMTDVSARQPWGEATIRTLINRLLHKKAIASERVERRHRYVPLVRRAEYVQAESQDLLDRLFGGKLAPLVAHFAENKALKPGEVARLKRLIEELEDDDR